MRYFISLIVLMVSSLPAVGTPGNCQTQAEAKAKQFLEFVLKSEWGWQDVIYVDTKISLNSYKVIKNSAFNAQKHEDYVFEFKSASELGRRYGLGSRFEVQMFANQFKASDEFKCSINTFRLVSLQEGVEL